jgi:hypothetical protein
MNHLTIQQFDHWISVNRLRYNPEQLLFSFPDEEYIFRIPIGDYRLQLDYRIDAAITLLPQDSDLLLFRKSLRWSTTERQQRPLEAVLHAFNVLPHEGILRLSTSERQLAFAFAYLTNRWGMACDSLYMVSHDDPQVMLFVPGSPESLFVVARTSETHHQCVNNLKNRGVPAYGKYVREPIPQPTYEDIQLGSSRITVDPGTGKPIGPGSDESVLSPDFLPPGYPRD